MKTFKDCKLDPHELEIERLKRYRYVLLGFNSDEINLLLNNLDNGKRPVNSENVRPFVGQEK